MTMFLVILMLMGEVFTAVSAAVATRIAIQTRRRI